MVNSVLTPDARALVDERAAEPVVHHVPKGFSDRFALGFTKLLRFSADTFFAKRYGHRAIVLETVAAVPGMVGAMFTHLTCLRRMRDDEGWIRTLDRFVGMAKADIGIGRLHRSAPLRTRLLARVESVVGARGVRAGDVVRKEDLLGRSGRSGRLRIRALNGRIDRS